MVNDILLEKRGEVMSAKDSLGDSSGFHLRFFYTQKQKHAETHSNEQKPI